MKGPNPSGLCQCGCGGRTALARDNDPARSRVKGAPYRYKRGHGGRGNGKTRVGFRADPETGCWVWQGSITQKGYGQLKENGRVVFAHRAYYIRAKGPIRDGLVLDHLCRNPRCVNPDHLEAVPQAVNVRRGRLTTLNWSAVRLIRTSAAPVADLAQRFGISESSVYKIRQGRRWREAARAAA
jgi:hypothetical protein